MIVGDGHGRSIVDRYGAVNRPCALSARVATASHTGNCIAAHLIRAVVELHRYKRRTRKINGDIVVDESESACYAIIENPDAPMKSAVRDGVVRRQQISSVPAVNCGVELTGEGVIHYHDVRRVVHVHANVTANESAILH